MAPMTPSAPTSPRRRTSTVVVLAAGKGERLNGVSVAPRPKPTMIVSGVSLAEHAIRSFVQAGASRFVFVVGFEAAAVEAHLNTIAVKYDCSLRVVMAEHWVCGNGASALAARRALAEDRFLLVMCDHLLQPGMVETLLERAPQPGTVIRICLAGFSEGSDPVSGVRRVTGRGQARTAVANEVKRRGAGRGRCRVDDRCGAHSSGLLACARRWPCGDRPRPCA